MRKIIAISLLTGTIIYKDSGQFFLFRNHRMSISLYVARMYVVDLKHNNSCYAPKNY